MQQFKTTGWLMIAGAIGVLVPYTILTIIFGYPDILRQDTGEILTRFYTGGSRLILTWFAFALLGLPLIPAYLMLGRNFERHTTWMRSATTIGVTGLIVQMIGLLRWTFVVPVIATDFANTSDPETKAAAIMSFKLIHQFGGVLLGEVLGQLFTIIWTIIISIYLIRLKILSRWIGVLGLISSFVYLMAQAELISTVIPDFPVWQPAGFLGSSLWLVWLVSAGIGFLRIRIIVQIQNI